MGMLLMLNRKLHKAYIRTRDFNFSLNGLVVFDLHGKTIGIVGTGKISRTFIDVCSGFGMNMLMYDPYPIKDSNYHYVSFEELCEKSDIISFIAYTFDFIIVMFPSLSFSIVNNSS